MEKYDRFKLLISKEKLLKIQNKTIVIVGLGGVGGYTLETLVRSGIKNIIIIDYDTIDITNINRQILALNNNIGEKKVNIAKKRMKNIDNNANIITIDILLDNTNMEILNKYKIDYIIDACDTINTKILLIKYALKNHIKIISCLGTGKRLDATSLIITTLDKTQNDPLAKIMRKKLREENISLKIPVVYSKEVPIKTKGTIIPSCSYVPAVAGIYLTNYVINDVLKEDF